MLRTPFLPVLWTTVTFSKSQAQRATAGGAPGGDRSETRCCWQGHSILRA